MYICTCISSILKSNIIRLSIFVFIYSYSPTLLELVKVVA